ncbi:MAG TPA: potassium channel protein [Rubricoccaceae bacterium]|nr:potassium channel protein [Rubricoccaceae bacterium]
MARRRARFSPTAREALLGVSAISVLLAVGTAGYMAIEGWTAMDALYMTFITLATIGFGETHPLSTTGRLFTMAISTVGIGTFAYIAARLVQLVLTTQRFRERLMQRRIDQLENHYVICGYGRLGQRLTRDLLAAGREVVVIDRRSDRVEALNEAGVLYVQGEAEEEETLRSAGLARAAGLVLVLPQDAANVFVALTAREIRPREGLRGLLIVARTNEQASIPKLLRAGADKVISPIEIGADRMAQTILRPNVDRFMEQVLGVGALDFNMEEARIERTSFLDGRSLAEIDFRRRFDTIVVGILKGTTGQWRFNPDAALPLRAGDTLVVLGPPRMIHRLREEGCAAGTATSDFFRTGPPGGPSGTRALDVLPEEPRPEDLSPADLPPDVLGDGHKPSMPPVL